MLLWQNVCELLINAPMAFGKMRNRGEGDGFGEDDGMVEDDGMGENGGRVEDDGKGGG